MIGASTVSFEKLPNGEEAIIACQLITQHYQQIEEYQDKRISALYPLEIGGVNSLWPLAVAARLGIPVVDIDAMGRAFPETQMTTFSLDGVRASPFAIVDAKLNTGFIQALDNHTTERLARVLCTEMGGVAFLAAYPITPREAKASAILGTLSFVQRIGETREQARAAKVNVVQALVTLLKGVVLFHGKVTKVDQRIEGGFTCGIAYFTGVGTDKGKTFEISFRNEYLLVQSEECPLCITPDLIIVLDEETGMPILTEWLRYGARVVTLGVPANKKWRTSAGIELAGPRAFNYNTDFIPVEKLVASHPPF